MPRSATALRPPHRREPYWCTGITQIGFAHHIGLPVKSSFVVGRHHVSQRALCFMRRFRYAW